jgi:riboflavin kinase/FMN adenylyltransferase
MHLAHQKLFQKLDDNGAIVVICTGYANLTKKQYRAAHTQYPLFYYPLEDIKHLSGEQFIKGLQEEFPKLNKIVVGYDFHFGHKALEDTKDLKEIFDGVVIVVDEFCVDGTPVHSRVIRSFLRDGEIEKANQFLGYNYTLEGYCIKGQGLGQKEFVPTINIDIKDFLIPSHGVYTTKTQIFDTIYTSVTFVGHRQTTDNSFACETHILDTIVENDLPHTVSIEFYTKLRNNKKFIDNNTLKEQIQKDIQMTKDYFSNKGIA